MKDEEYDKTDEVTDRDEEREKLLRRFEAGCYMQDLRGSRSLSTVARDIGMSPNYISNVEKGRLPSDHYIRLIASYYGVDEDDLFIRWGKMPILTRETVQGNESLQKTLAQIGRDKVLSDEEKEKLYDDIFATYQRYLKKKELLGE
ncbi:MAG: helix-turn-helix transcriptional regulator [Desulfosporosinus sp.]|nr:helix-turn-helix transcriptional regulator [Desulfosporosinus sp.]